MYKKANLYLNKVDYDDYFTTKFTNSSDISIIELTAATFEFPNWIKALFPEFDSWRAKNEQASI